MSNNHNNSNNNNPKNYTNQNRSRNLNNLDFIAFKKKKAFIYLFSLTRNLHDYVFQQCFEKQAWGASYIICCFAVCPMVNFWYHRIGAFKRFNFLVYYFPVNIFQWRKFKNPNASRTPKPIIIFSLSLHFIFQMGNYCAAVSNCFAQNSTRPRNDGHILKNYTYVMGGPCASNIPIPMLFKMLLCLLSCFLFENYFLVCLFGGSEKKEVIYDPMFEIYEKYAGASIPTATLNLASFLELLLQFRSNYSSFFINNNNNDNNSNNNKNNNFIIYSWFCNTDVENPSHKSFCTADFLSQNVETNLRRIEDSFSLMSDMTDTFY
eukprot:gene9999-6979_t